jgi:small multidrug resistance pump
MKKRSSQYLKAKTLLSRRDDVMKLFWFMTAATCYTAGGIFIKLSQGLTQLLPTLLLFISICIGAVIQSLVVRHMQLGVSYIMILGLEATLALRGSVVIFREGLSQLKILGVVLVLGGIGCLQASRG